MFSLKTMKCFLTVGGVHVAAIRGNEPANILMETGAGNRGQ